MAISWPIAQANRKYRRRNIVPFKCTISFNQVTYVGEHSNVSNDASGMLHQNYINNCTLFTKFNYTNNGTIFDESSFACHLSCVNKEAKSMPNDSLVSQPATQLQPVTFPANNINMSFAVQLITCTTLYSGYTTMFTFCLRLSPTDHRLPYLL